MTNQRLPGKWWAAAFLVAVVAGCSEPNLPDPAATQKKVDEEKFRQAKQRYAAFLDQAVRAADVLESQPQAKELEAEIKKLNALLAAANDVYPENVTLEETGNQCKGIIRFFTSSLTTINRHFTGKTDISEPTKQGVYKACASNVKTARQTVDEVRVRLGLAPAPKPDEERQDIVPKRESSRDPVKPEAPSL